MKNGYKIYIKDEDHFEYCENYLRSLNYYKGDSCYDDAKVITIRHNNNGVYYAYATLDLSIDDLLEIDIDNLAWLLEN